MGRARKILYKRDGIYYARIQGKRWSTDSADEKIAYHRALLMESDAKPWEEIRDRYRDQVIITIHPQGYAHSEMISHELRGEEPVTAITPYPNPDEAIYRLAHGKTSVKPPLDCRSIEILLEYEFHLMECARKPEKTLLYYRQRFDALMRYVRDKKVTLDSFDDEKAISYAGYRLDENIREKGTMGFNNRKAGPPTINKEINFFRELWGRWRDDGRLTTNPWSRVTSVKSTAPEESSKRYSLQEIAAILEKMPNDVERDVCLLQACIGSRPGEEVLRITKEDAAKNRIYSVKKHRWDTMYYSDEAKAIIERLDGKTKGLTAKIIWSHFRKACKKAGVRVGSPYWLRHSFGTQSRKKYALEVVQKLLRHRDIRTTTIYAKVEDEEACSAATEMQRGIVNAVERQNKKS
jgi:site-specific recombinase XerD